jgi:hypothetical protein
LRRTAAAETSRAGGRGVADKNAVVEGNTIPAGQQRQDPWVVVEIVASAIVRFVR